MHWYYYPPPSTIHPFYLLHTLIALLIWLSFHLCLIISMHVSLLKSWICNPHIYAKYLDNLSCSRIYIVFWYMNRTKLLSWFMVISIVFFVIFFLCHISFQYIYYVGHNSDIPKIPYNIAEIAIFDNLACTPKVCLTTIELTIKFHHTTFNNH